MQPAVDERGPEDVRSLDGAWLLHPKREPVAQFADLFGIGAAAQKDARQVTEAGFAFHFILQHPVVGDPKRNVFLAGTGHGNSGLPGGLVARGNQREGEQQKAAA